MKIPPDITFDELARIARTLEEQEKFKRINMNRDEIVGAVAEFLKAGGVEFYGRHKDLVSQISVCGEEARELSDAFWDGKGKADIAREAADVVYTGIAVLLTLGVDPIPAICATAIENLNKRNPETGKIDRDPKTGKLLKPEGWEPLGNEWFTIKRRND